MCAATCICTAPTKAGFLYFLPLSLPPFQNISLKQIFAYSAREVGNGEIRRGNGKEEGARGKHTQAQATGERARSQMEFLISSPLEFAFAAGFGQRMSHLLLHARLTRREGEREKERQGFATFRNVHLSLYTLRIVQGLDSPLSFSIAGTCFHRLFFFVPRRRPPPWIFPRGAAT